MNRSDIRKNLQIHTVELKHLDQFNELLRYVFQVTNQVLIESGYEKGEIIRAKRPVLERSDVIGWFDGDTLVSQLSVYPCFVNIHGKIVKMGGLTGVGTYPEYSGLGLMNDLIAMALERMREKGQYISYLYPYSIPYYRKKGWEIMSDHMTYRVKDTQLPKFSNIPGHVKRLPIDHEDVIKTYDRFAHTHHGTMLREEIDWEEYWRWENEEERIAGVYYDACEKPAGYLFYWIKTDELHIKDMIYLNQQARKGLWNFITAHFSMVDEVRGNTYTNNALAFFLDDSQIEETIEPYYMARIVDLEGFLGEYPFQQQDSPESFELHFETSDPIALWNRKIISLSREKGGSITVGNKRTDNSVKADIQTLSTMFMSYRRPTFLLDAERLETSAKTLEMLESIIPDKQPYFSDFF